MKTHCMMKIACSQTSQTCHIPDIAPGAVTVIIIQTDCYSARRCNSQSEFTLLYFMIFH